MNHEATRASSNPSPETAQAGGLPRRSASETAWAPTPVTPDAFGPSTAEVAAAPSATGASPSPQTPTGWSPTSWRIDR